MVAGSLMFYVVLGTLALNISHVSSASGSALRQQTEAKVRQVRRPNTKPLQDFLTNVRSRYRSGELSLDGAFELSIEGERLADGTLTDVVFSGNPKAEANLKPLALEFVQLLNADRMLAFLGDEAGHVSMRLRFDDERVSVRMENEFATDERAREKAHGYGNLLGLARFVKRGRPEAVVLNNLTASANGKQLVLSLEMSRESLGNLLFKQITPN
jgi:hypothetical protein